MFSILFLCYFFPVRYFTLIIYVFCSFYFSFHVCVFCVHDLPCFSLHWLNVNLANCLLCIVTFYTHACKLWNGLNRRYKQLSTTALLGIQNYATGPPARQVTETGSLLAKNTTMNSNITYDNNVLTAQAPAPGQKTVYHQGLLNTHKDMQWKYQRNGATIGQITERVLPVSLLVYMKRIVFIPCFLLIQVLMQLTFIMYIT